MGRIFLGLAIALVGALVVHIAVVFTIPRVAENNAWGRLSRIGPTFRMVRIDPLRRQGTDAASLDLGAGDQDFAFVDPAFITAGCRFSLADGLVRVAARDQTSFWSASIYSRQGDNLYSINDRSAVDGRFDLLIGTHEQIVAAQSLPAEREDTAIPVEIPAVEGYITLRVLVDEESARPLADAFLRQVVCEPAGGATSSALGHRAG
ncbi:MULTISPECIES: hypothetical protein [unclassified Aureimonas]|uniref:DUF1254 domain-containing protein n=1 Tax=unclassified Aureimonas TaxID=2615206 RepID=UPI0006F7A3A2|nr:MULTISPECIES: hypothetical protein [unclassified Aureimonas]KQT55260.1 hypothetical protein ASG62_10520 [Aureimonas sp. Leaf427]KQT71051.1 hypothetical protein ASG54_20905 [Aureimonas sp. Leaf460]